MGSKQLAANLKEKTLGDLLIRRNPLYYRPALSAYDRLTRASLDERKSYAQKMLARTLAKAAKSVYGRKGGWGRDIRDWPILEKDQVRVDPNMFLTTPAMLTSPASTSGSSGLPLVLWRSLECTTYQQAAIDRILMKGGVDPKRMRFAVIRGENIKDPSDKQPPFWKFTHGGQCMVMSTNHLAPDTVKCYRDALEDFKPEVVLAYPTSLESLCRLINQTGLQLKLPFVVTQSELHPTKDRIMCVETLHCKLADYYGQAERTNHAYSWNPDEYFFLAGYAYNELLPAGEDNGYLYEIVGTHFHNLAMPLVRYRSGDFIRFQSKPSDKELEDICYGMAPFEGILGRFGDFLVSPDGGHLMGIDHIPRDVENIERMQIIQEAFDFVRILYIPTPAFSEKDRQMILHNVELKLPKTMRVQLEPVKELERTETQKRPFVIKRPGVK